MAIVHKSKKPQSLSLRYRIALLLNLYLNHHTILILTTPHSTSPLHISSPHLLSTPIHIPFYSIHSEPFHSLHFRSLHTRRHTDPTLTSSVTGYRRAWIRLIAGRHSLLLALPACRPDSRAWITVSPSIFSLTFY